MFYRPSPIESHSKDIDNVTEGEPFRLFCQTSQNANWKTCQWRRIPDDGSTGPAYCTFTYVRAKKGNVMEIVRSCRGFVANHIICQFCLFAN